ncbi:hypothetical protein LXM25_16505 [Dyadobacter sp. LJ53]|uniref:hypothetical protein n=1 Tax=Dyadobacter chenwenxiniae TaxID=2906456 RepID=UPI001F447524|nr:hypothetical protein [Dyadobacter chenwenxiniae]MCF0051672.1 hypothetical protein [Dyadobacter chenwenxiniae]
MKKAHMFSTMTFAFCVFIVASCNQRSDDPVIEEEPGVSVNNVIEKHKLTRLSEEQTNEMLQAGNYLNFDTAEEADAFLTEIRNARGQRRSYKGKVDTKGLRTGSGARHTITVPLSTSGGLDEVSKMAATTNSDDAGSTALYRPWDFMNGELRVAITWGSGYSNPNSTASVETIANYNTWESEQSTSSYNAGTGEIGFTIYGKVHVNVVVEGVGTIQSYNAQIKGSYNPTTGESVVNPEW